MQMRWIILFVLFFARTVMAFQFQSVAALSPLIIDSLAVTLADVGLLIGLYLGPGIVVAVGGGAVATRFGDKRTVIASLALMLAGGAMVAQVGGVGNPKAARDDGEFHRPVDHPSALERGGDEFVVPGPAVETHESVSSGSSSPHAAAWMKAAMSAT